MPATSRSIAVLATIGLASLIYLGVCIITLALALTKESDVTSAFLPLPPREAFSGNVFWITGASSGIVSILGLLVLCDDFSILFVQNYVSDPLKSLVTGSSIGFASLLQL